jgi:hypothetical protein
VFFSDVTIVLLHTHIRIYADTQPVSTQRASAYSSI